MCKVLKRLSFNTLTHGHINTGARASRMHQGNTWGCEWTGIKVETEVDRCKGHMYLGPHRNTRRDRGKLYKEQTLVWSASTSSVSDQSSSKGRYLVHVPMFPSLPHASHVLITSWDSWDKKQKWGNNIITWHSNKDSWSVIQLNTYMVKMYNLAQLRLPITCLAKS